MKTFQNTLPQTRWFVFLLATLLASSVHGAELLLVMEVYARAVPTGQGEPIPALQVGSSVVASRSGFTVAPGQRIPQSVSAQSEGGRVIYYLIFSAAKGVAG